MLLAKAAAAYQLQEARSLYRKISLAFITASIHNNCGESRKQMQYQNIQLSMVLSLWCC